MGLYLNNNNSLSPIAGTPFEQIETLKNHIVNDGVKNELPYPYPNVSYTTGKGITWTDNGDGTITAQGVATALNQFYVLWKPSTDPYGDKYKINGVPAGAPSGVTISYRISDKETDTYKRGVDIRAGVDYETVPYDSATEQLVIYLRIASGTNLTTPITFKPMIWKKDINSDSTYAHYTMTNEELTNLYVIEDRIAASDSTIAANSSKDINISTTKEGYEAVGVLGVLSFSSALFLVEYVAKGTYVHLNVRNTTSSALTGKMSVTVLFKKVI